MVRVWCFVVGHKWHKLAYEGADTGDGFYLRCRRCGKENHDDDPGGVRGAMGLGM